MSPAPSLLAPPHAPGGRRSVLPWRWTMARALPPGFREIQHQEFERLFGRLVWIRFAAVPVFAALFGWLALVDPSPWRR